MEKTKEKVIVNALTGVRILGTFAMPVLFTALSTPAFLLTVGLILLTDLIDGKLARHWEVSTLGGRYLDMTADKLFAFSLLIVISLMYPIMAIPLGLEVGIATANIIKAKKGGVVKSSQLGRAKTVLLGISMFSLLVVGLSPELSESLNNIKIDTNLFKNIADMISDKFSSISEFIKNTGIKLDDKIESLKSYLVSGSKEAIEYIQENKEEISKISAGLGIIPEAIVAGDYTIKTIKEPDKKSNINIKILKLLRNKQFLKDILFNEQFYEENKDKSIPEILENEKVKKYTLNNN